MVAAAVVIIVIVIIFFLLVICHAPSEEWNPCGTGNYLFTLIVCVCVCFLMKCKGKQSRSRHVQLLHLDVGNHIICCTVYFVYYIRVARVVAQM